MAAKPIRMGINVRRITDETERERDLPSSGVGERDAGESRCADCGRAPLIGESVAVYVGGELRCELCRTISRAQPAGQRLIKHAPDGPQSRVRVIRRLPV